MIHAARLSGILLATSLIPALSQIPSEEPGATRNSIHASQRGGPLPQQNSGRTRISSDESNGDPGYTGQKRTTKSNAAILAAYDNTIADNASAFASTVAVAGVTHHTYYSSVLNINIGYNVYLPSDYSKNPSQRFPVLFFLHGRNGDENSSINQIVGTLQSATNIQPMIIVFVNGGKNSKYMDPLPGSKLYGVWMAEYTIVNELIPTIDATYRTFASKRGRAIQGFSMGGMGALRLAFKYPDLFSSVYAFAPAADDNANNVASNEPTLLGQMFNGNKTLFAANEPQNEALSNQAGVRGLAIHITIGSADSLLSTAQGIDTLLTSLGIAHDPLETIDGIGHDLRRLQARTKSTSYQFASRNFAINGELTPVGR